MTEVNKTIIHDESNPWTTNETRQIYENPWIRIREDSVIQPDGKPGIYGVVHFRNKAVGVLPIDDEGYTYLIGQYRYPLGIYSWEIPEGGCPEGENPLTAGQRELLEETGLTAQTWELLCRSHLSNSATDEEAFLYLAKGLQQGVAQPEGTERLACKRVSFQTAVEMVENGEITDAMSMLAILTLAKRQNR
ncbi:MAG: NUDIX hydrolase [Candidatus Melainabacteria bacterium]|jgi:8-oxo-dGTP pyrophosphatase MutT (NUDIX family)|nr:NUDIX hydrolase [Candidatus Melainabacteria bacterium]